jgi:pyruvate/2-oxoglutarate dehydrogenase complex dihydrolipoamide dehydrogenase (E3) component
MDLDLLVVGEGDAGIAATHMALQLGAQVALAPCGAGLLDTGLRRAISRQLSGLAGTAGITGITAMEALLRRAQVSRQERLAALRAQGAVVLDSADGALEPGAILIGGERRRVARTLVTAAPGEVAFPGAEDAVDAVELLASGRLPARALVLGDDLRALEVGSWLAALGSRVTVLLQGRALSAVDPALLQALVSAGDRPGLSVANGTLTPGLQRQGSSVVVRWSTDGVPGECEVDQIIHASAAARRWRLRPWLPRGKEGVAVGPSFETEVPGVHASGQARGALFGLEHEARVAVRQVLDHGQGGASGPLARVIFSAPELAQVGASGRGAGPEDDRSSALLERTVRAGELPGPLVPPGWAASAGSGGGGDAFLRVFFDRGSGTLAGAQAVGPGAEDLIDGVVLALSKPMAAYELAALPAGGTALGLLAEAARRVEQSWRVGRSETDRGAIGRE